MSSLIPILTYHKIAPVPSQSIYPGTFVPPRVFNQHLAYLAKNGFDAVTLSDAFRGKGEKPVVLTFDDGFLDFHQVAAPELERRKMLGTVFLVSDHLGGDNAWDTRIGDVAAPLMTREQILELAAKGFEFGSHTLTHCHLDHLTEDEQRRELVESKANLEHELGLPMDTFCYPYGGYNETTLKLVAEAGYKLATTCDKGHNTLETPPFKLNRIAIRNDTSLPIFIYKLWRWYRRGR